MTIPLIREPSELIKDSGGVCEVCLFCRQFTRYWHENTNNPVCPVCAKTHKVAELPDHGQSVRRMKRKARNTK